MRERLAAFGKARATSAPVESESGWKIQRRLVAALLPAEVLLVSLPEIESASPSLNFWANLVLNHQRGLLAVIALAAAATVVLSWPAFRFELRSESAASRVYQSERSYWLFAHLMAVAAVVASAGFRARAEASSAASMYAWFLGGALLVAIASICWSLAFASADFWSRWFRRSTRAFVLGIAIAVASRITGHFLQEVPTLKTQTLLASALILGLLRQNVVINTTQSTITTQSLTLYLSDYCSGIEGITLIVIFTLGYVWFCRRELKFPHALILLPIGSAIVWLLNVVRIAGLVLISRWSDSATLHGFHSLAGWGLFIATGLGMVAVTRRTPLWVGERAAASEARTPSAAEPYLVPFLITIGTRMITSAFFVGFDFGYPIQAAAAAIALWYYVPRLKTLQWTMSGGAICLGTIVAAIWVFLDAGDGGATAGRVFSAGLSSMQPSAAAVWLMCRVAGALLIAPLVEELAFRGYLLRKLVAADFERVEFNRFSWLSFMLSSIAFGFLHQSWVAGTIAGMMFAIAMYQRGKLSDAIGAHAVANGLIIMYAVATGQYSLLSGAQK